MLTVQTLSFDRSSLLHVGTLNKESRRALSRNVRRLMKEQGLTQNEVAAAAGLSRSTVAAVLGGRYKSTTMDTVTGLSAALGVPIGVLLVGELKGAPVPEIVQEFLTSEWAVPLKPTPEEIDWLTSLPAAYWAGMEAGPEAVADTLRLRRQHPKSPK